jgi:SAM-dependent methyltransferase
MQLIQWVGLMDAVRRTRSATCTATRTAVGQGRAAHDTQAADVETSSDAYAQRFAGPVGRWLLEVQADCVRELLAERGSSPLSVLEVGGGHGQLTGPLLHAGHRVVVHGSRTACHQRLRAQRAAVQHVTSPLWQLPFRERAFDLVAAVRLLAHVEDWAGVLAELARVSRRYLLVDFPARSAVHRLAPGLFAAKRSLEGNTRPYFDYAPGEVEQAARSLGMEVLGVRRQFAFPMVLHRTLRAPALSRALERAASGVGVTRVAGSPVILLAGRRQT